MDVGALGFMVGEWSIEGEQHGAPIRGRASARPILGGRFLEYREIIDDYEDLCVYGVDPRSGELQVFHFGADGTAEVCGILLQADGGWHWVPRGLGPFVRHFQEEGGWRTEVWYADAAAPEVVLRFRRA